jgi:hypothetical protein
MTAWVGISWAVTVGAILVLSATITWIWWQRREKRATDDGGHSGAFSIHRYQPMEHLLSEDDFAFLSSQPGYTPEIGARWKRDRRHIFRLYLGEMRRDFLRLHAEARVMAANADAESADLVGTLMRQQIAFWRGMAGLELRLALRRIGIGKVDVRPLLESLEAMRADLARLNAPQAA